MSCLLVISEEMWSGLLNTHIWSSGEGPELKTDTLRSQANPLLVFIGSALLPAWCDGCLKHASPWLPWSCSFLLCGCSCPGNAVIVCGVQGFKTLIGVCFCFLLCFKLTEMRGFQVSASLLIMQRTCPISSDHCCPFPMQLPKQARKVGVGCVGL